MLQPSKRPYRCHAWLFGRLEPLVEMLLCSESQPHSLHQQTGGHVTNAMISFGEVEYLIIARRVIITSYHKS